jgi:DNA-damage-inducible protein J
MSKQAFIRARIESDLKKKVELILSSLGLNATEVITLLYKQIDLNKGLPFEIKIPNAETKKTMDDINKGKNLKKFKNKEEMFKDLGL